MNAVETRDLTKIYGDGENKVNALTGVSLSIPKGMFTAIVGSSGSGKTTLLNMLGGLDKPTRGRVMVDGIDITDMKEAKLSLFRRRKIGFVFQNYNLIPTLTVYENIVFPLELDGQRPDEPFIREVIHGLHLSEKTDAYPYQLSGGAKQRVAIARAISAKPAVILADEPTGNLDSKNSQNVAGLLKECVAAFKQTLVMITHDLELAQLAQRHGMAEMDIGSSGIDAQLDVERRAPLELLEQRALRHDLRCAGSDGVQLFFRGKHGLLFLSIHVAHDSTIGSKEEPCERRARHRDERSRRISHGISCQRFSCRRTGSFDSLRSLRMAGWEGSFGMAGRA